MAELGSAGATGWPRTGRRGRGRQLAAIVYLALLFFGVGLLVPPAIAAQPDAAGSPGSNAEQGLNLIMIEEDGCGFCIRWHREVGEGYPASDEGRRAPLVVIDRFSKQASAHPRVVFTPTFILVGGGRELGRIVGYPGADFFWSMLADLMRKAAGAAPARTEKFAAAR